ncbi:hypothetical protein MTO96_044269 [Rhipicephalus appendiculatus]
MIALDATRIIDRSCDCPAGMLTCNHLIAVLRTTMLLQSKGFSEAPYQLSCPDLPQQWRIPRRRNIRGCPLQSVHWRKVKEGATSAPMLAVPKERHVRPTNRQEQEEAKLKFTRELLSFGPDNNFAKVVLLTDEGDTVQSRFGLVSSLAPQSYQQSLLPHGFTVLLAGLQPADECHQETIPTVTFFDSCAAWNPPAHLQASSIMQVRGCYGIKMEPLAAQRYEHALRRLGHAPIVSSCGLLVNPAFPWLVASPDRIVYDPVEQSYGVVEIKCPYSLRDHTASALENAEFCSVIRDGVPKLKRDHQYY